MAAARPGPPHPEAEVAAPPPLPGNRARSGPGEKRRLRGPALGEPPPVPGEPPPALGKPLASPERAPLPAGGQTAVPGSGEGPGSAGEGLQPQLRAHLSPHQESSPRSAMEGASSGQAAPDHGVSGAGRASRGEAKLTEAQGADPELRQELQKARDDYSMATGVISSLQRQLEIQESQLRRAKSEKEMLQKKLREQENQLQALSAKFCSLREGRKHEEMMATIEENCSLRQVVTEQESKLAEQNKLISELEGTVRQLQAEVLRGRYHIHEQQRAQEARQSQAEMLQHRELQARVALERISSRFERYRSKIIQATFSTAGSKAPQAELADEEVLEAMQKIINERLEFHQMLRQKGVKVPSLYTMDATLSPASARERRKSPARAQLTVTRCRNSRPGREA
ncbi:coiled-coil domain-containing protein 27 isoform X2 [Strix uralensis]|uniref:coiled-coil domain-containing protein 27 isoform X2 n=1 Tax=Strix uralensis TaxID=36305 RepID=UPI003DA70465